MFGGATSSGEMYHDGSRELQDRFDSRRIADRLEQITVHDTFTADDREFIGQLLAGVDLSTAAD